MFTNQSRLLRFGGQRGIFARSFVVVAVVVCSVGVAGADDGVEFFETKIRPVLVEVCFRCHGDSKTSGELQVDSRERLLKGGASGAAIVPGRPEESLLIRAIQRQDDVSAMPPDHV